MEHFEIDVHKGNEPIDYVLCQPKGLRIKVIPPGKQPEEYNEDQMIISGMISRNVEYDFEIVPPNNGEVNKQWSMQLFFDAIEYYCQNILDEEPQGFRYSAGSPLFYPYDNSPDFV